LQQPLRPEALEGAKRQMIKAGGPKIQVKIAALRIRNKDRRKAGSWKEIFAPMEDEWKERGKIARGVSPALSFKEASFYVPLSFARLFPNPNQKIYNTKDLVKQWSLPTFRSPIVVYGTSPRAQRAYAKVQLEAERYGGAG
jgi:hypothetical protein